MIDYKKIRRIMKDNHITIKDLANKIGVPYKTLLYNFQHEDMKVSILLKICEELKICVKDIIVKVDDQYVDKINYCN